MDNKFLAVNKEYFNLGLKSLDLMILAQIEEFLRGGNDCYVTNDQFSKWFGESPSTVKRSLDKLEESGLIYRVTTTNNAGSNRSRQRKLYINEAGVKKLLANNEQGSNSIVARVKNDASKVQDEPIIDNIKKKNLKDNIAICLEGIGIEYKENTRKALEAEIGKELDASVIQELVNANRGTWTKISGRGQGYKFATLKNIVSREYNNTVRKLEAQRLEGERIAEERANNPRIDYSAIIAGVNQKKDGLGDISNLLDECFEVGEDATITQSSQAVVESPSLSILRQLEEARANDFWNVV